MRIVGITGPTGAGKTSALLLLEGMDGRGIDCDDVYHRLLRDDEDLQRELMEQFGKEILNKDGKVDRKALAGIAFDSQAALEKLDAVTTPYIIKEVDKFLAEAEDDGVGLVGIDGVTLIESGMAARCNYTVAVTAPDEDRLKRIMEREGITEEYARQRMDAQHDNMWYWERCDFILLNDKTEEIFESRGRTLFEYIAEITSINAGSKE